MICSSSGFFLKKKKKMLTFACHCCLFITLGLRHTYCTFSIRLILRARYFPLTERICLSEKKASVIRAVTNSLLVTGSQVNKPLQLTKHTGERKGRGAASLALGGGAVSQRMKGAEEILLGLLLSCFLSQSIQHVL